MKKHNQIRTKNSRGISSSQGKKPAKKRVRVSMPRALKEAIQTAAKNGKQPISKFVEKACLKFFAAKKGTRKANGAAAPVAEPITIVATPRTGLPGVSYNKGKSDAQGVQTGRFNWKVSEFEEALRQGRFLITALNQFHRLALELEDRWCDYGAFLEVIADSHIEALRGSVPLYWIEQCDGRRNVTLISLRGQTPGKYPADDSRSAKDARALEREIQYRASANNFERRSHKISALSNKFIRVKQQLRSLQIAYIAAHTTADELTQSCDAIEAIMELAPATSHEKAESEKQ